MSDDAPVDESKRATLRRFAALGAAGSLTKLAGEAAAEPDDEGSSEVRDAIRGYLSRTPGAHFSKLRDDLKLGTGETQHHLRQLVRSGRIESHRDGDYRRFFPAGQFSSFEQTALGYLRRPTPRGMLIELLRDPAATGRDLADALDVSRATVSKYAGELEDVGLIARDDGYAVREPETVLVLVVRYADSFDDRAAEFAAEADEFVGYDE
ncbi:MAG: putative transcriptional regulator [Halobacteriales archaeon]|jgi:predicted transcriptional regulator